MVTAACVAWIIVAIKSFRSGKGKAAKITAIVLAGIFQLFAAAFFALRRWKANPILVMALCGCAALALKLVGIN
mgnify:CR=1 FL=1